MSDTAGKQQAQLDQLHKNALMALESGQYDYAVSTFRKMLELDPAFTKASDGIKTAKMRKLQKSGALMQKIRKPLYILQATVYRALKKKEKALDKYESLFAMAAPPHKLLAPLADIYYEKNMIESAVSAYKAVLQNDRNNIHCLRKLGKIYCDQSNTPEAKRIYDHLASIAPEDGTIMKEVKDAYALFAIDRGRWEEEGSFRRKLKQDASEGESKDVKKETPESAKREIGDKTAVLKKQLEKDPQNTALRTELADSLSTLKRFDEAIIHYRKLLNQDPGNKDILIKAGNIYINEGDFEKAVRTVEKLHSLSPENAGVLRTLAGLNVKQDAPLKAIEAYQKLLALEPDNTDVREELGKLYEQNRYFEEAIAEYEKVLAAKPDRADLEQSIGNLYLRDGKTGKAVERFEKVAAADPGNIPLRKVLADQYIKENRVEDAQKLYREILAASPEDETARTKLKETEGLQKAGKFTGIEAKVKELEGILEKNPDDASAREKLEEAKNEKLAIQISMLEDTTGAHPENMQARFDLGMAYRQKEDVEKAIKEFQQISADPEKGIEGLHMLGLCFEEKKMYDIASRQLEKAEAGAGESAELKKTILYDLGRVYEKSGKQEKALEKYKEIYEIDILYKDVAKKIEDAYKKQQ